MKRKRCFHCGKLTHEWDIRAGIVRCWDCVRIYVNGGKT